MYTLQVYFTNLVLVARKPAFLHHLRGKQNYQALFVYRSELGENLCHFLPYFTYNSAVLTEQSYKTNYTHSIFRTIEARASLPQQVIKMTTT